MISPRLHAGGVGTPRPWNSCDSGEEEKIEVTTEFETSNWYNNKFSSKILTTQKHPKHLYIFFGGGAKVNSHDFSPPTCKAFKASSNSTLGDFAGSRPQREHFGVAKILERFRVGNPNKWRLNYLWKNRYGIMVYFVNIPTILTEETNQLNVMNVDDVYGVLWNDSVSIPTSTTWLIVRLNFTSKFHGFYQKKRWIHRILLICLRLQKRNHPKKVRSKCTSTIGWKKTPCSPHGRRLEILSIWDSANFRDFWPINLPTVEGQKLDSFQPNSFFEKPKGFETIPTRLKNMG